MFAQLLIHPTTHQTLEAYAKQPPHALVLIGPEGMGKLSIATHWAEQVSTDAPQIVTPDERGTITIEMVRELYRAARSKSQQRQVIIIDHAENMSLEAENAFLKLLEEPRDGVTFILTAPYSEALLPTVQSRVQSLDIQTISTQQLQEFALKHPSSPSKAELSQLLFIAKGRPATLVRLLENPVELAKERDYMTQAKELLIAKPYERFLFASKFSGDRVACTAILEAMLHMVSHQLKRNSEPQTMQRWLSLSQALEEALTQLTHNGNVKAQLLKLFISY